MSVPLLSDDDAQISAGRALSREESDAGQDEYDLNWRQEVASRVQQHRYRRGKNGDAAEAMELEFAADEALTVTDGPVIRALHRRDPADDHALLEPGQRIAASERARIIRFPRMLASLRELEEQEAQPNPAACAPVELASATLPRIMDVAEPPSPMAPDEISPAPFMEPTRAPEQMELLPSFEDIQLEPAYTSTPPDMEIIPRAAHLQERLVAGLIDLGIVALAAILFGYSFVRMSEDAPHSRLAWLFALCVGGILWILFQYLFLVHGSGTPGMLFAQLELKTFEGRPVNANTRRVRAAASALSALSIGLGYAWAFVDEDRLGWHDRMTRTLLKSRTLPSSTSAQDWDWEPV